jgi:hypothetical protein
MSTKVFISWGGQLSKNLANALRQWLPSALQFVKPYFSPDDIEKGAKWSSEIANELQASHIGIICLTRDNTERPWILFEAGALSKIIDKGKVCTLLFNVEPSDITGPLASFQSTVFRKDEFKRLLETINKAGGEEGLEIQILESVFDTWWPKLEDEISAILSKPDNAEILSKHRPDREILSEILQLSRMTAENVVAPRVSRQAIEELLRGLDAMVFLARMENPDGMHAALGRIERPLRYICRKADSLDLFDAFVGNIQPGRPDNLRSPIRSDGLRSKLRPALRQNDESATTPVEDDQL